MKIDELPPIAILHILKYFSEQEQLGLQTLNKHFYAAVADAQLSENARYFAEGYRETEALFDIYDQYDMFRNKFIFGVLYLAYSRKFKYNFHNYPRASAFAVGTRQSEFVFLSELLLLVTATKYA